jgi:Stress responsive A/B Barrel Domain
MSVSYQTKFGSLKSFEKGRVEPISDDVKNYAFSNCFEIASKAKPYEKVVFGQNQIYVLETIRAEGTSPWYTCAHDEFALSMDGEVDIHLIKLDGAQAVADENQNGAVHLVMWQFKGDSALEREVQAKSFSTEFAKLLGRVPGLCSLDVGPNCVTAEGAWDMAASMIFESRAALEAYASHPAHLGIKTLMGPARKARAQVDVELMC